MLSEDVEGLEDLYNNEYDLNDLENEKYYWKTKDNTFIPVDSLDENHIINIVIKFGKDKLNNHGYKNIVKKFNEIRKKEKF